MGQGPEIQEVKHQYLTPKECKCRKDWHCMVCDGGLGLCTVCGCFEGSLATECPGVGCYVEYGGLIYNGSIDYRDGAWRKGVTTVHMGGPTMEDWRAGFVIMPSKEAPAPPTI